MKKGWDANGSGRVVISNVALPPDQGRIWLFREGPLIQVELLKVGAYVRLRPLSFETECFRLWAKSIEDTWVLLLRGNFEQYKETWQCEMGSPGQKARRAGRTSESLQEWSDHPRASALRAEEDTSDILAVWAAPFAPALTLAHGEQYRRGQPQ